MKAIADEPKASESKPRTGGERTVGIEASSPKTRCERLIRKTI